MPFRTMIASHLVGPKPETAASSSFTRIRCIAGVGLLRISKKESLPELSFSLTSARTFRLAAAFATAFARTSGEIVGGAMPGISTTTLQIRLLK